MYYYYFCKDPHLHYNPYLKKILTLRSDWQVTTNPDKASFTGCSRRKKLLNDPYEDWSFFNRKEYLATLLHHGASYYPESHVIRNGKIPPTITQQIFQNSRWFIKGNVSYGGKEVYLVTSLAELNSHIKATKTYGTYILQKEIKPKLLNQNKFDMRWYIVVTSVANEKHVFIYDDGYVRRAKKPYLNGNKTPDRSAYLTNVTHAFKKVKTEMMCNKELPNNIYDDAYPKIKLVVSQLFQEMLPALFKTPNNEGFTFLGIDVILDETSAPYILEVNNRVGFLPCLISDKMRQMHEKLFDEMVDAIFIPILAKQPLKSIKGWHMVL